MQQTSSCTCTTMAETETSNSTLLYLPKNCWSARYNASFYTVKIESKRLVSSLEEINYSSSQYASSKMIGGNDGLPAYYYEIVVYREHNKNSIFRRYSQFKWLHEQLTAIPQTGEHGIIHATPLKFPPGTCLFHKQDDSFAQNRLEQLAEYLDETLSRPVYAKHPAVVAFLEL